MCYTHPINQCLLWASCGGGLQFQTALHVIESVPMKVLWLLRHSKSNMCLPDRGSPQLQIKNALDQGVHPYAQVCYNSQQNHISVVLFDFSAGCMPKTFIVNPEQDQHKRNSKTASGNSMLVFFPLLLFPHIKQFIDFIVPA